MKLSVDIILGSLLMECACLGPVALPDSFLSNVFLFVMAESRQSVGIAVARAKTCLEGLKK